MLEVVRSCRLSLLLFTGVAGLAACQDGEVPRGPASSRSVELSLSSSSHHHVQISKVMVTLQRIDVYSKTTRTWITAAQYGAAGRPLDLLTLHRDNPQGVGAFELPPGRYEDLRFFVKPEGTIVVDEGSGPVTRPLEVHDHARKGIEVDGRFQITAAGFTQVELDFDARHSISIDRGQGRDNAYHYKVHADIDIVGSSTSPISSVLISAAEGGEVHLLGRAGLVIPPGALREDTEIEMSVTSVGAAYAAKTGFLPGNVIRLEPDGLTFDIPAQFSIAFNPAELRPGHTAQGLTVLSRSGDQLWREEAAVLSPDLSVLTAPIEHFSVRVAGSGVELICAPGSGVRPGGGTPSCQPATTIELRCSSAADNNVSLYDVNGDPVWSRDVDYRNGNAAVAVVSVTDQANCTSISDMATCDTTRTCGVLTEGGASRCIHDPAYFTLGRTGCGDATVTAKVIGAALGTEVTFPIVTQQPYRAFVDTIGIVENGDNGGDGEVYWRITVDGTVVSDHPQTRDTDDDSRIFVYESAPLPGYFCPDHSFSIGGSIFEEDDGANGEDEIADLVGSSTASSHLVTPFDNEGLSGEVVWHVAVCQ